MHELSELSIDANGELVIQSPIDETELIIIGLAVSPIAAIFGFFDITLIVIEKKK